MQKLTDPCLIASRHAFRRLSGLEDRGDRPDAVDDGSMLLRSASRHRVVGLLRAGGRLPSAAARPAAYGQALHSARYSHEAGRIFTLLNASLRRLVLIKGPILAIQAWPDPGLRTFDDLDFRCHRRDGALLGPLLESAGYRPVVADARQRSHYWHFGWGNTFVDADGRRIEFNHRWFAPHYPWPARRLAEASCACEMYRLDTHSVRAPTPALHLLLACLHALWHGGERLAWMADVAGLLVRHGAALEQARTWTKGCGFAGRALQTGCLTAEQLFGPGVVQNDLPDAVPEAAGAFIEQLQTNRSRPAAEQRRDHNRLLGSMEWMRYTARRAFIPGDGDFRKLVLSPRLRPLYWLYRPLRFVAG